MKPRIYTIILLTSLSSQSANADAIEECMNRAHRVSVEIADLEREHMHSKHLWQAEVDRNRPPGKKLIYKYSARHSRHLSHRKLSRSIDKLLDEAGFRNAPSSPYDLGEYGTHRISEASRAKNKRIWRDWDRTSKKWLDSKDRVKDEYLDVYAEEHNKIALKAVNRAWKGTYDWLYSDLKQNCTNDPADCHGDVDIDPSTGIVFNQDTSRSVDLSLCALKGFPGANFAKKDLQGVNLENLNLQGADFRRANLAGANLAGANLQSARFDRANLTGAVLSQANLEAASLARADLEKADLSGSNLTGATLTKAAMGATRLTGATLKGAKFIGARVTVEQLSAANWSGAIVEKKQAKALNDLNSGWEASTQSVPSEPIGNQ